MATIPPPPAVAACSFLTNEALVLLVIAGDPEARMRDIALAVGLTERGVQRIIACLVAGGFLAVTRAGRRNVYEVQRSRTLTHPLDRHATVGQLLAALKP